MQPQKKNLTAFLLFFLIVFSAYGSNYDSSWHFDDYPNIVDNPRIHIEDFKFKTFKEAIFAGYDNGQYLGRQVYRPVSMSTFALNWYIGQDNVLGYWDVKVLETDKYNVTLHFVDSVNAQGKVHLKLYPQNILQHISLDSDRITMKNIELKKGEFKLEAYFRTNKGRYIFPLYVSVKRLD
jgi:hypothetical protein